MQMNFVITPEFEMDIFDLMMHARIKTRSEAVRHAVHLVAEVMRDRAKRVDAPNAGSGASR
jgi:Arc/MetJ-type ribon-helix-helix transcriptional regulator